MCREVRKPSTGSSRNLYQTRWVWGWSCLGFLRWFCRQRHCMCCLCVGCCPSLMPHAWHSGVIFWGRQDLQKQGILQANAMGILNSSEQARGVGSQRRPGRAFCSSSAQESPPGGTIRAAQPAAFQSFNLRCCWCSEMMDGQSLNGCTGKIPLALTGTVLPGEQPARAATALQGDVPRMQETACSSL